VQRRQEANVRLRGKVRRLGGRLIRRLGLLPEGDPDGLGEDEALRGQSLPFSVMLYFPETTTNLYQLRQWYGVLQRLDRRHRVGIVCLDSRSAAAIRAECDLPVVCCGRIGTLEDLVSRSDVALALYVSHNIRNLHPLRFPTMLHAYLGHGESDKAASASNQVKAYDIVLVPGAAGLERLQRNLMCYDAAAHVRLVGRPQLDVPAAGQPAAGQPAASQPVASQPAASRPGGRPAVSQPAASQPVASQPAASRPGGRPTVLYAPTWEGGQPSMAYSSVVSHGEALLRSLLECGRYDVRYRPHPRTGANRAEFAAADQRLRAMVRRYRERDPGAGHEVDLTPTWDFRTDGADLLVCDISAVAGDWMTTGKPIVVTIPQSPQAFLDADTVLGAVPGLPATEAATAAGLVAAELAGGDPARRRAWVEHAMGDTTPGAAITRFLAVCDELVELRERELAARTARLTGAGR
jgi:hypothetical protein